MATGTDQTRTRGRLLTASARHSYDPDLDIDWSAPVPDGVPSLPEHRVSLYGTPLWQRLTPEQRIALGTHEWCSITRFGIWFETLLMRMLLRDVYRRDPGSDYVQYALTEIGDETRHSIMFAREVEKLGASQHAPGTGLLRLGALFGAVAPRGPAMFAATLLTEETLDRLQRELMADETLQPLVRMTSRIHVVEEARHVTFARTELARQVAVTSRPTLLRHRQLTAAAAYVVSANLIHPGVYAAVGLDPRRARALARANPYHRETLRWMGKPVTDFLTEVGMIGRPGRALWRRSGFLA
ncbi:diiron oxygenase [Actinocatenispora sera]|uniref:AurF N-oxygenase family protein n=1 Tax=Actinocatenispora sera TaxID=390989 RepID=UPI0033F701B6